MTPSEAPPETRTIISVIDEICAELIGDDNIHRVGEKLREIAGEHGLGVAVLAAWRHGLRIGHIRLDKKAAEQVRPLAAKPYVFVNVRAREIRGEHKQLQGAGVMSASADPMWFFYHEDALLTANNFDVPELQKAGLIGQTEDVHLILEYLASKQLIVEANVNNRQIQFKDLDAKRFLEASCPNVYVVVDNELGDRLRGLQFGLSEESFQKLEAYVAAKLKQKRPCNYCSVQALNPTEATLHSRQAGARSNSKAARPKTRRNYQFGFTFAPFGDPREVCHFLGWDFPHISDTVLNMDPQDYSFSDLIELVRVINDDIARFAAEHGCEPFGPIAGVCNHWAGNTIYHQHYQFFHIPNLPLLNVVDAAKPIAEYKGVVVSRLDWQAAAYVIHCPAGCSTHLPFVAERVAREWLSLNGEDEIDASLGNGIRIKHHTQNTYVTVDRSGALLAVFIPRHRGRLGTASPANEIQKLSAGVMEMMGYYLVNSNQFEQMEAWDESKRSYLASSWLRELSAPAEGIRAFEANVHDHLSGPVIGYLERLDACLSGGREGARFRCVADLLGVIGGDGALDSGQRTYVKSRVCDEYNRRIGRAVFLVPPAGGSSA